MLRAGNVHSAHKWRQVLDPILSRYGETGLRRYFRADAAFAKPDIYEYLEERHILYAIGLPGNEVLQREIAPLLIRPVGRPPKRPVILSHISHINPARCVVNSNNATRCSRIAEHSGYHEC